MPKAPGIPPPRVHEFTTFLAPFGYREAAFEFDGKLRFGSYADIQGGHANVIFTPPEHALGRDRPCARWTCSAEEAGSVNQEVALDDAARLTSPDTRDVAASAAGVDPAAQ